MEKRKKIQAQKTGCKTPAARLPEGLKRKKALFQLKTGKVNYDNLQEWEFSIPIRS